MRWVNRVKKNLLELKMYRICLKKKKKRLNITAFLPLIMSLLPIVIHLTEA